MAAEPRPYRFTMDEFEQMGAAGILSDDARVELIDGEIIEMRPIGVSHANSSCNWAGATG